jgi:hypothetical protein
MIITFELKFANTAPAKSRRACSKQIRHSLTKRCVFKMTVLLSDLRSQHGINLSRYIRSHQVTSIKDIEP